MISTATRVANGQRITICRGCGHEWQQRTIRHWWPIRLRWAKLVIDNYRWPWFKRHGWQTGSDRHGNMRLGWTFHLGRLKVCFGPQGHRNIDRMECPGCHQAWWVRP